MDLEEKAIERIKTASEMSLIIAENRWYVPIQAKKDVMTSD